MLLFQLYFVFIFPNSIGNRLEAAAASISMFGGGGSDVNGLMNLLCLVGPLGTLNTILLLIWFCYSAYKWLTVRDFLAPLRVSPNEFNEDDLMALEKAVEQTVRISLDEIGLDPDDLKPVDTADFRRII